MAKAFLESLKQFARSSKMQKPSFTYTLKVSFITSILILAEIGHKLFVFRRPT